MPLTGTRPPEVPPSDVELVHIDMHQLNVGYSQSVGKVREHNEDSLVAINSMLASNGSSYLFGLYIVADGMGGHKHGEIASGLAVRTITTQIIHKIYVSLIAPQPAQPDEAIQEILETSLQEAHRTVMKEAPGSGTTLSAVLVLDKQMSIAHVGDSRVYSITPDGNIQVLTRDHSLVMRMMELGQLTEEEASVHPQRNVLYRALGQSETFAPDITTSPLPATGHILICSDGLWGVIPAEQIVRVVNRSSSPQIACQLLIDAANLAGGPDNISAVLIRLPG